jgi:hypothetical protein
LKSFMSIAEQQFGHVCRGALPDGRSMQSKRLLLGKRIHDSIFLLLATVTLASLPVQARSQALSSSEDSSDSIGSTTAGQLDVTYVRPTERTKVRNYVFDTFGPYPIVGAAFAAGINQFTNSPPEWNQGVEGYSKRFGSDFGIAAVTTTTRYGLAQAFREDTLYYRCECSGFFPRLRHAALSTLTGRQGEDGHRVFSIPALVAPYAGTMTAVYGWYPNRYGAKDAFRMGNYTMLWYMGSNVGLEFLYSGPHSLLSRMHLSNAHGSPAPGPNH